jgi:FtsH-binding integral membrane protein
MKKSNSKNEVDKDKSIDITKEKSESFVLNVFMWMFSGLILTTISSLFFGLYPDAMFYLITISETGARLNVLGWVVLFTPFLFILIMNFGFERLNFIQCASIFVLYSIVMGISLGFIFYVYDIGSIFKAFLSASVLFGVMLIVGYTTKTDLTSLGRILFFGLIGIIIASLINFFANSSKMDYIISIFGVIIFTGLTAYDMQKIKFFSQEYDVSEEYKKIGIMCALILYLDLINLFLDLLRLFKNDE